MEPIELVQDIVSAPAEAPKKRGRPPSKLAAAAKKPGIIGKRARFAETLKGFK